jgi:DNA-binding transcriptional MerR regulator
LFYRQLGFPLEQVAALLDDPDADPQDHLRRQHDLLTARIADLQKMAGAVKHAMEARKMGINLTPEEKFEVFGEHDPEQYAQEAEQRWGDTDNYKESQCRAARYTKADWQRMQDEAADWGQRYAGLMTVGQAPSSEQAMELAEEHRQHISRWFYECTFEIHRGLADGYVADERFTQHYEAIHPGMAAHLRDAIHANAARHA